MNAISLLILKRSCALNLLQGLFFFRNESYCIGNAILLLIMSITILKSKVQSIWQSLRKKLAAGSRIVADAKGDLKKRQDFLPVRKHGWGGDGEQNKKGDLKKRQDFLPVRKHGWGGDGEQNKKKAFGEGRSLLVQSLAVLFLVGGMPVFASASFTLVHYNNCPIPVFPSLIPTGSSMKIDNSISLGAIDPSKEQSYTLPEGWAGFGFFSTGCTDASAARNCTTGNCEGRGCTAEESPVATTYLIDDDGSITMSAGRGYNLELEIMPMCVGCTSASCKAQLESCPNHLRLLNSSGAVAGCKPTRLLHFSESQCTIPGDYSTSTGRITCPLLSWLLLLFNLNFRLGSERIANIICDLLSWLLLLFNLNFRLGSERIANNICDC